MYKSNIISDKYSTIIMKIIKPSKNFRKSKYHIYPEFYIYIIEANLLFVNIPA